MKRTCLLLSLFLVVALGATAQISLKPGTIATFDLKAHTTFGVDLRTGIAGLQTSIDTMQIWFEIFPDSTRGVIPADSSDLTASIRVEGSKYALKWSSEPFRGESYFDRIIARLDWKNIWMEVARSEPEEEPTIFTGRASLAGLFDLGMLPGNRNMVDIGTSEIPLSGQLKGGAVFDSMSFDVGIASKGTWTTNTDHAWLGATNFTLKPFSGLEFKLGGLGSVNYQKSRPGTSPFAGSALVSYSRSLGGKVFLKPMLGFDGKYDVVSRSGKWEAGGTVALLWNGEDYTAWSESINNLSEAIPVGLSLSANYAWDGRINILGALFEEARKDSFIPNLGGFFAAEVQNIDVARYQDRAFALAGRLEYLFGPLFTPYAEARYIQGYKDGKLTGTNDMTMKVGILVKPAKHFSLDMRYERHDRFGVSPVLDPGLVTTTFSIRL